MSNLTLRDVTKIYTSIKHIVEHSRKVYMVSMNAMLFSRKMEGDTEGFVMVTSQLRDFSTKLNGMLDSLMDKMSKIVSDVAHFEKLKRNVRLIDSACQLSTINPSRFKGAKQFQEQLLNIERALTRLTRDARQLSLMTKMGKNLVVLARIESEGKGRANDTLKSITAEMEKTMDYIEENINRVQKIAE